MEVNGYRQLFGYQHFLNIFVFNRRKKCIKIWNKWRVSKWWHDFYFGANYPILHWSDEMMKVISVLKQVQSYMSSIKLINLDMTILTYFIVQKHKSTKLSNRMNVYTITLNHSDTAYQIIFDNTYS